MILDIQTSKQEVKEGSDSVISVTRNFYNEVIIVQIDTGKFNKKIDHC